MAGEEIRFEDRKDGRVVIYPYKSVELGRPGIGDLGFVFDPEQEEALCEALNLRKSKRERSLRS